MPQATLKDLDKPLGCDGGRPPAPSGRDRLLRFGLVWGVAIAAVLLFGGHFLTETLISRSPFRPAETPVATAPAAPAHVAPREAAEPTPSDPGPPAGNRTAASEVEQNAGVAVVRPAGNVPGAIIITVPDGSEPGLAPAPDPRVTVETPAGPLPRIGDDGSRAAEVYARPAPPHAAMAPARIAVVVDGLGLSAATTQQAIETLPADVTLALVASGTALPEAAAAARQNGHEVLLSLPAEIPGAELTAAMARFAGYAGILTAAGADRLGPLAHEAEQRGLLMLASAGGADVTLTQTMAAEAVEQAFARAERLAQRNGRAIILAEGSPSLLRQLARWTASLERRGVLLVPATSLIANPKG